MKYFALVLAILAFIEARPQMWKNYGMREEIEAVNFPNENESPIFLDKRSTFRLTNPVEPDSSEEMDKTEVISEPKNVGVELIFGPDRYASNPFEIQDTDWDLSKYASMKDQPSTENNDDSNENVRQNDDTLQRFYLPTGLIIENPQGEVFDIKEKTLDNSNSAESNEEIRPRNEEIPRNFYSPQGIIIMNESPKLLDEQIVEMPQVFPEPQVFQLETTNNENSEEDNEAYFPKGLVVEPFQMVDVDSYDRPVESVFVKNFVEIEDSPRMNDVMDSYDPDQTVDVEVPEVPEVPEVDIPEVEIPDVEFPEETNFDD